VKAQDFFEAYKMPLVACGAIALMGTGALLHDALFSTQRTWIDTSCFKNFSLTRKTLDCGLQDESQARMQSIDAAVDATVARYLKDGRATRISVWTRDLETNQWASTNEFERYAPASMMKVPIMIAYLKLAETNPAVLDEQIAYVNAPENGDEVENFLPASLMTTGQNYTVRALITNMIVNSDNNAMYVLLGHIDPLVLSDTLVNIGIEIPKDAKTYDFLTAKTYANIFRILYNASYLNRRDSQMALDMLTQSTFKGISTTLPSYIRVAHKFGERKVVAADGKTEAVELHDCGIVYHSPDPYSLCIMTAGSDFKTQQQIISDISALVYEKM
jgi:beta-lactamase class A